MDKKYLGSTIPLPKAAAEDLDKVRRLMTTRFGFDPSRSDTVRYLVKYYLDRENGNV